MNKPFFDERDIQTFFDSKQPNVVNDQKNPEPAMEIEFEPEIKPVPVKPVDITPKPQPILPKQNPLNEYQPLHPANAIHPSNQPQTRSFPSPLPVKPFSPPLPPPGSLPKIQNSFVGNYDYKRPSVLLSIAKFLGLFCLIFIVSFVIINGPALWKNVNYYYVTKINKQSFAVSSPVTTPAPTASRLIIPKLKIDAPIIWNVDDDKITTSLEKGLAHYNGTALPGEIGNVFITGHSSYYLWALGDYKNVFALLGKLEVGDQYYIQYKGKNFLYKVSEIKTVMPDDLTVLNPSNKKIATLMTCVPVGTNLKRLIVIANQVQ